MPVLDSRPLEDPSAVERNERRRRQRSLRWLLLSIAVMMTIQAVVDVLLAPPGDFRFVISLLMGGVALLAHQLLRAGRAQWVVPLLVTSSLVFTGLAMYSYGSVRAASSLALLGVVVLAGTYQRLPALLATTGASLLLLGALTWAEAAGRLTAPQMPADFRFWVMSSVVVVVIGALLRHTRQATDEAHLRRLNQMEDRLRLEHERDQSLRRFGRIFRLNPNALMVQRADTQAIVEVNPAFERNWGYPGDQVTGLKADFLWAEDQQWQAHSRLLFAQGCTDWRRVRWLRSDGQAVDAVVYSELNEDPGGPLILTTVAESAVAAAVGHPRTISP
jgi:PAS domain S-box-containing protein